MLGPGFSGILYEIRHCPFSVPIYNIFLVTGHQEKKEKNSGLLSPVPFYL